MDLFRGGDVIGCTAPLSILPYFYLIQTPTLKNVMLKLVSRKENKND